MVAYTDTQLEAMGLTPAGGDRETLKYSEWDKRLRMHAAIKAQAQNDKP